MPHFIPVDFDPFAGQQEIEKLCFTNEPQREIWLSCVIGGDDANRSYNESVSLKINGRLNTEAFKKAINNLVLRHEALRATVSPNGESLIIYKNIPVALEFEDLSQLDKQECNNRFNVFLKKAANTVLNLKDGPLFKIYLHKTAENEHYCTIIKHHIIGDGWSTGIILEDLSKMYNAYSKGEDISLAPAYQISDYASLQSAYKLSDAYKETEDYWLHLYKDNVPILDLPVDNLRKSPRSYNGNRIDQPLTQAMIENITHLSAKAGSTLVTTLLAAFEVFLYKQTHQRDIVVGLPASGQAAAGMMDVVGHCVNMLPLKTRIDTSLSFLEYLKKRKKEVLDAYDHQRITFGELIKKLYIPRDSSRIPLVPVIFNIDKGMDNAVDFDGLDYKLISNPRTYENFELYLNITGSKEGMILEWSYNIDLFTAASIKKFNNEYYTILNGIISGPELSIAALVNEKDSISIGAASEIDIHPGQTINSLIAESTRQFSDKVAVSFNNSSVTYAQLNEKADQLASFLIEKGIKTGDIVALLTDRSIEMVVCLLAVLKSGAIYLPVDPDYPRERIEFMLTDSSAKLLLASKKYQNTYKSAVEEVIIDEIWPSLNNIQKLLPLKEITGYNLAYILYTSGSTGKPKGVKVTHRNLVNFLTSMRLMPGISESDRLLAVTSISFDIAGLELYLPLISGAELVLASTDATKDGRILLEIIRQKNITIMQATPSTWQMMIDAGWEGRYPVKILSGGEAMPPHLANKLLERGDGLWNMYGPTETTIWSTVKQILPGDKEVTIGKPINNTQVYIMDEEGNPVPINQEGEIYIGGYGVADGYLDRTELTAEKFIQDEYSKLVGAKLYRTGDLGKMLANGEIQCLGRVDYQVKIRGHRIELGEIETKAVELKDIKQCVVIAREDTAENKRLVAYVTLNDALGTDSPSWKERWDTLYEIGAADKQSVSGDQNIDGSLLTQLSNKDDLKKQQAEWLQASVERIKAIKAKRIYEIGCGAGQVLFEVAPDTDFYLATDYADTAIENINKRIANEAQKWGQVRTGIAAAADFSIVGNAPVDLVVINSVAQYFPNADYLINVIKQSVAAIKESGCIFIGDMQGKNTLQMHHNMDYLLRASECTTVEAFKDVIANRVRIEEEFIADPAFFYLLPKLIPDITGVDVQLRKGHLLNETTKYHYDVWLYVGKPVEIVAPQQSIYWKDIERVEHLSHILATGNVSVIKIKNIPNLRTAKDFRLQTLLDTAFADNVIAGIKNEVISINEGVDPDLFWKIGDELNYQAHVKWTTDGTDGLFDVVFIKKENKISIPIYSQEVQNKDIYDFSRTPLVNSELPVTADILSSWKERLLEQLPAYMVPDDFVVLKKFSLTPNAKIDRKALPKPQFIKEPEKRDTRPHTPNEQLVANIWADILGIKDLRLTDDFFLLGGHSLLAVKVMVSLEKKTGKRLTIATLFEHSTIEKLAIQLSKDEMVKDWDVLVPIKAGSKDKVPLFFVHGADLNVLLFKAISEFLDEDQPVYGLQALGLNNETNIPTTIIEMAAMYVADILKVHPNGPYALAGYSLGGFIAFEIARQLQLMGKEIVFLGIIDTYAGTYNEVNMLKKIKHEFQKAIFLSKSFVNSPKDSLNYQRSVVKQKLERLIHPEDTVPKDIFTKYEGEIYMKYSDALDVYKLTGADVKVTLFAVENRQYFVDDLITLGWNKFAQKGVTTYSVSGDHKSVLYPPNNWKFALVLQQALNKELLDRESGKM